VAAHPAGPAAAAAAAGAGHASACSSNAMRQFQAPTLLAWGPDLFEQLEDRWAGLTLWEGVCVYTAAASH
jgi:hypothetical protein